jgi:hypothetical protein
MLFVGGLHRSGTSLIGRALAAHPEASGLTSTGAYEDEGQHIQGVMPPAHAYGGPGKFAFHAAAHLTEASPLATEESAKALRAAWLRFADPTASVIVEKSPPNLIRARLLQALFPSACFVMVVRHPVAVSCATQRWSHTTLRSLLRHWSSAHAIMLDDAPRIDRLRVVRYEDFVIRPQAALDGLFRMAGLPSAKVQLPSLDPVVNDRYAARWRERFRFLPLRSSYLSWLARCHEAAARTFGYSMSTCDVVEASSPEVSRLMVGVGR